MKHSILRKTPPVLVFLLFVSVTSAFACSCLPASTTEAFETSAAVFSGKVTGFEYRKGIPNKYMEQMAKEKGGAFEYETKVVRLEVSRWWKGAAPAEVFMVTGSTRNSDGTGSSSSCDYNFKEGETYLVFGTGSTGELRTNPCLRTRPLSQTNEDLKILGAGYETVKEGIGIRD